LRSLPRKLTQQLLCMAVCVSFALTGCASNSDYVLTPNPTPYYDTSPSEYYLYLPSAYSPEKDWPVLVGVHGYSGDGKQCLDWWQEPAEKAGFVLVCPSFGAGNVEWEFIQNETNLLGILRRVGNEVRVQKKIFLAGFSAGGEFALLFSYSHPNLVQAVSLLSSGNYYEPFKDYKDIRFLVLMGDRDNPVAEQNAASFVEGLQQKGYTVEYEVLPGVGHEVAPEALEKTILFFQEIKK
jgi:dipeptidyl aminopeptidase/acylaminoacyl peptidase